MSAFGLAEQHGHLFDAYVAKPSKADKMVGTIIQTLARGRPAAANAAPTEQLGRSIRLPGDSTSAPKRGAGAVGFVNRP
jgi:hypothetical protein